MSQIIFYTVLVVDVEKAAFWFAEESGEVLDSIAFGWCIDDAEHLFEVVLD